MRNLLSGLDSVNGTCVYACSTVSPGAYSAHTSVIILRYFDGLTLAQTAETLQIPQGTVATRQRKALSLLRLELTDSEEVGA